jgi:hypothetical protein
MPFLKIQSYRDKILLNSAESRGTLRNSTTKFLKIFANSSLRNVRKWKKVQNSVLMEFRKHPQYMLFLDFLMRTVSASENQLPLLMIFIWIWFSYGMVLTTSLLAIYGLYRQDFFCNICIKLQLFKPLSEWIHWSIFEGTVSRDFRPLFLSNNFP